MELTKIPNEQTGGPFCIFQHPLLQNIKKLKKGPFSENFFFETKSHNAEKLKGGPFGLFQHPFCRKTTTKMKGDLLGRMFFFRKKVSQCRKN